MLSTMQNKMKSFSRTHEFYLLLINILFIAILSVFAKGSFLTLENFADMLVGYSPLGIMSAGVLVVLISGGIDISFTAVATVAQYIMALFILNIGGNILIAFAVAAASGIALGCVNAVLVPYLKAPAIIITIATMNVFYGTLMWLSSGKWLYNFPEWFSDKTPFASMALPLAILFFAMLLTSVMLRYTNTGRKIFAIGGNMEAAKRVGINVLKVQLFVYAYVGLMAAMGATVQTYIVQNVAPNSLIGNEMQVLAMVVLGGTSLVGGRGTVHGTVLGLILVAMIGNGLVLLGVSSYWHNFCMGVVILLSFCVTALRTSKRAKGDRS
ncbi:MAG TPA: ABC transporter permease [Bacillota bacterium]|nr:ABC transporter permease [Bacillota bacterium]